MIYCGIDWAEKTLDVALVNDSGKLRAKRHITDDAAGYKLLLDLLAQYGDTEENPIPVAIKTSRGLLVAVLRHKPGCSAACCPGPRLGGAGRPGRRPLLTMGRPLPASA